MNLAKKRPPGKFHAADFNPNEFSKMLWHRGWIFTWERAEICPCRESTESDAGRRGCPVCGASGWLWHSPTEIRAVVTSANMDEDTMNRIGPRNDGSVAITVEPEQLPARFDRYTAKESVYIFREIAVRAVGSIQALRMPIIRRRLQGLADGDVTVGVLRARAQLASGVAAATPLVEGVDLDVNVDGYLDWTKGDLLGTAPAVGKQFSIAYTAHPVYVVDDQPYAVRDTRASPKDGNRRHEAMPVKVICRLKFGT